MKKLLSEIIEKLRHGDYRNKSEISRGVVLQILSNLGWNTFDTDIVMSEYSVGNGRVDFALALGRQYTPCIFIEVKQPGKTDNADDQLFRYAYSVGVQFAVLTDGKAWNFYLPSGQGRYEDRRIYKLDITERTIEESIEKLQRYLAFDRVRDNTAFEDAKRDYSNKYSQSVAQKTIPEAWKDLIDNEDEMLFNLIADSVEKKCGYKPKKEDIGTFLSLIRFAPVAQQYVPKQDAVKLDSVVSTNKPSPYGSWYMLNGQYTEVGSAKDVVVELLRKFQRLDKNFFKKCYNDRRNYGRNRTYIARSTKELYKGNPNLEPHNIRLTDGWFLLTNFSNQIKENILNMAIDIMHLQRGKDVDYHL